MSALDSHSRTALKVMTDWSWLRCDPDGVPFEAAKALGYVVNRLAMEGIVDPPNVILRLLCNGDLTARGDYRWRKYQWGYFYQLEGLCEVFMPSRWRVLSDVIYDRWERIKNQESPNSSIDLVKLQMKQCQTFEWNYACDSFSTAVCPREMNGLDPEYFEEWFCASRIEIWPSHIDPREASLETDNAPASENRSGRPPAKWWADFAEELAVYVHENGIPEGKGHDGQSDMIDGIFANMASHGKAEPGRPTVQPVINAVLRRIRSADN